MIIKDVTNALEKLAPLQYQEDYDNVGLLVGNDGWECSGVVVCLDVTIGVVMEAIEKKCNLIVSHHPLIFKAIKTFAKRSATNDCVLAAIKNDVAVYAFHTNLDNVQLGVNGAFANKLDLQDCRVLLPQKNVLKKLQTFVPVDYADVLRDALFAVGAGHIGNYSECSFATVGEGTFMPNAGAVQFVGKALKRHVEMEKKVEVIFPKHIEAALLEALYKHHPYECPAYDVVLLENSHLQIGSGLVGILRQEIGVLDFLNLLKSSFGLSVIRHNEMSKTIVKKVAICGGAGGFLIPCAMAQNADVIITADIKYSDFFMGENKLLICDIGHFESEEVMIDLVYDYLMSFFPTLATLKTSVNTNPISYFI